MSSPVYGDTQKYIFDGEHAVVYTEVENLMLYTWNQYYLRKINAYVYIYIYKISTSSTKDQRKCNKSVTVSSTNDADQLGINMLKHESRHSLYTLHKIKSKWNRSKCNTKSAPPKVNYGVVITCRVNHPWLKKNCDWVVEVTLTAGGYAYMGTCGI